MLQSANALGVHFRAHVKTHKTVQLTQYQVGDSKDIRLVASTIAEIEHLLPYMLQCKEAAKKANVVYGLPVTPSVLPRLASIATAIGPENLILLIDHPDQVHIIGENQWPGFVPVLIKIASARPRAGVSSKDSLSALVRAVQACPQTWLMGTYTHLGQSYSASKPDEALQFLLEELGDVVTGAEHIIASLQIQSEVDAGTRLLVSLGATPTATCFYPSMPKMEGYAKLRAAINNAKLRFQVELHAGVYSVLDLQQLATHARPATISGQPLLSRDNLALRILAEVASLYNDRERPEALIGAGCIALGREPCKSYTGWGIVVPNKEQNCAVYDPEDAEPTGWIVGRISQEHGTLVWQGSLDKLRPLRVGEKVSIWPNHACIASAAYGWYYVVDSDTGCPQTIRDVWVRCRGW
eukprot:Protomagalhaensia_sp_Gyna_25__1105@NODE_153_length_4806_cov_90_625131_g119_i0_p2_GENE_NODE_153_length_4806_cov_90_625131_g119_i0NODE_153_length_4806_cov_90_625131_g119_i0_p2_ORF_typecomplete_len468_score34_13Dser_dehydrat/PF14031_6/3_6e25Ala_racemase_N/PF01168_20/2_1e16_NODE_153_length_4806_cov_90_625131_g119_i034014630